jgi:hypothetical protein
MRTVLCLIMTAGLVLLGCRKRELSSADAVGEWTNNRSAHNDIIDITKETLHVRADGTFTITNAENVVLDRGTWRILRESDGNYLNFSYEAAPGLRTIRPGNVTRDVLRAPDGLRMDISPDDDVYYVKIQ